MKALASIMVALTIMGAALALAGCNKELRKADNRVLCSMEGEAFIVSPNVGDTSFVKRQPDSDRLCTPMRRGGARWT